MTFEPTGGAGPDGTFGPRYRVIKPCLRRPATGFVVEDLGDGGRRRLLRIVPDRPEVRVAADQARRVVHDRIAGLHRIESGRNDDLWLVGDSIEGETLAERLDRLGPLHESWILDGMAGVARAIDQAQAMGVPHGDLRPESIMIDEREAASVVGFAVDAAIRGDENDASPWTAPEVVAGGGASSAADVYAFAAIVFTALNGRPPSLRGDLDSPSEGAVDDELDESSMRRGLRRAALRGLDRDPARRPRSCGDLMAEVDASIRAAAGSGGSNERAVPDGLGRVRTEYATPMDLLDLESAVADIVPRKARLVLKEHPAVRVRWEKGEHFLSSGAVYKQLQQWQAAGEALERARIEFDAALVLDRGLVASRTRHEQVETRLKSFRWADHPAAGEMRDRLRALIDGEGCAWWVAWDEGALDVADAQLDAAESVLQEAAFLNREIASSEEWRSRWVELSRRIPDRVLDRRWAEEIRDHRASCRRGDEAFEQGRFATAGGIWATRLDRLAGILELEARAYDGAIAARRRFDEAMGRAPKARPISRPLREALDRLIAASDRIEKTLMTTGDFDEANRRWSDAAGSIGGLVQQDVERFGRVETARENHERTESAGRPKRATWTRLADEFVAIRSLAAKATTDRENGDFDQAIEGWSQGRQRLEQAFLADIERHREAILAVERFGRMIDGLPPRALDRSVRDDIDRFRRRRGVLDDWMASGRFTEVEDAVRRALDAITKALEIDATRHQAAVSARDRAVAVDVEFPPDVPQVVLDAMKPLFADIDATAVQARQAFELGEYVDCAEAWERTIALKHQATEDLQRETERFLRRRRRQALVRTIGAIAAMVVILLAGSEFGARAWFGSLRTRVVAISISPEATRLLVRQAELLSSLDGVLAGPSVGVNILTGGLDLLDRPAELAAENEASISLRNRLARVPSVEVAEGSPAWLHDEVAGFDDARTSVKSMLADGDLDGLDARITELGKTAEILRGRITRADGIRNDLASLEGRRPANASGFDVVERGWDEFEGLVRTASSQFDAAELDAAETSIGEARDQAESLGTLGHRLTAEQARDGFDLVWTADDNQPVIRSFAESDRRSVEDQVRKATEAYGDARFETASEQWSSATERLEGLLEIHRGPLQKYGKVRDEWDALVAADWPTEFLRVNPGKPSFKAKFDTAVGYAAEAEEYAERSDWDRATELLGDAIDKWTDTVRDVDAAVEAKWDVVRHGTDAAARRDAAAWLSEAMIPGSPEQVEAALSRDRLVWEVEPRDGEIRTWPIDEERSIEMRFVSRNAPFSLPPNVDQAPTVRLSGYWISTDTLPGEGGVERGVGFGQAQTAIAELGSAELRFPGEDGTRRVRFRLPTEAEWYGALDKRAFTPLDPGEWCRDRFVAADWWLHLSDRDPGGPTGGEQHVVRTSLENTGRRAGGPARVRVVLSPVAEPEVIAFEDLQQRRDPRIGGRIDPDIDRTRRTITLGAEDGVEGATIEFVSVPIGDDERIWVATCETTQAVWRAVMRDLDRKGCPQVGDDLPVVNVTEMEIQEFLRLVKADDGIRLDLPTADQWEAIALAGGPGPYAMGGVETSLHLDRFAWMAANAGGRYHPVGAKSPSIWGLHDLHGNVAERCKADAQNLTAIRGGSYESKRDDCRIDRGGACLASESGPWLGFRVVARELPKPKAGN